MSALDHVGDEPFFALNGDILTDLDLTAMLARHRATRCRGDDRAASRGGRARVRARRHGAAGRITEFREKPPDPIPGDINAGTYVLEPSALRAWNPGTYIWIEGEVFPSLIRTGPR